MPPNQSDEPMTLAKLKESKSAALTVKTVSAVLELDPRTVLNGIKSGEIPSIRVGRRVLIPRERFISMFDTPGVA